MWKLNYLNMEKIPVVQKISLKANIVISAPKTEKTRIRLPVKKEATKEIPGIKVESKVPEFKAESKISVDLSVSKGNAEMKKPRKRRSSSSSSRSN